MSKRRWVFEHICIGLLALGSGSLVSWAFPHVTFWSICLAGSVGVLVGYLFTMVSSRIGRKS